MKEKGDPGYQTWGWVEKEAPGGCPAKATFTEHAEHTWFIAADCGM